MWATVVYRVHAVADAKQRNVAASMRHAESTVGWDVAQTGYRFHTEFHCVTNTTFGRVMVNQRGMSPDQRTATKAK